MAELTQEEKQFILDNTDELSGREISRRLWGSDSRKSTVNDFIKKKEVEPLPTPDNGVKMLFIDIEVSASVVAAFSMFKHFSTPDHVIEFPYVLTFAYKWLNEDQIRGHTLKDYPLFRSDCKNDYHLIEEMWALLDEADVVVAHNSNFDIGWFNQRCVVHGLTEPSPYKVVCTLKALKSAFSLPSNSLDYSTRYFEVPHEKRKHEGISLWIKCMDGDEEALDLMLEYNIGDIPTCESLYLKILPFMKTHPNIGLYTKRKDVVCRKCGSTSLTKLDKSSYTTVSEFDSYRCDSCGSVQRGAKSKNTAEQRGNLLR